MVGIMIPGADQIERIAPARDPGVTASPDAFGAQIGTSEAHFGDALSSLGAHLYQKRQASEDQVAVNTYNVNVAPALQRNEYKARQDYPDGGPDYIAASQAGSKQADADARAAVAKAGITPSKVASAHMDTVFAGHDMNMRVGAVTYDNNAGIEKLKTANKANTDSLAAGVLAGGDVDEAVRQSDQAVDSAKQLYGGGQLDAVKKAARDNIYQAAVDNAVAGKDPERARELNAKYFGGAPRPGQTQADPLVRSESGGNPKLVNSLGFAGTYQFGAPRLETLGVYTPGPNENLDTWNKTGKNAPGKWSGTFTIDGFPQVKTLQDFLANPAAQKAVFDEHISDIDEEATKRGLDKYVGQTVAGVPITRAGVRDMAHLGGIGGAEKFLNSGGQYNPADSNGTKLSDYARMGSRTTADSPNVARALSNNSKIDSMDGVNRIDTTSAIKDDLLSVQQTGVGDSSLSADRITKSLGPNAAADWVTARVRAKTFYDKTQDFSTLPPDQMNARLIALAPKPGQEEFAAQDALHTAAIKKADAIMALRKKDPAESVSDDPEVKKAVAASGANPDDVNLRTRVITARVAAQQRAGIAAPSPLPVDETQRLLKPINDAVQMEDQDRTKNGPSRVVLAQKQLVKDLQDKYGSYAPDVMRELIGQAAQARDRLVQADAAGKVMANLMSGVPVDPKEARRLKVAQEADAAAKALRDKQAATPPPGTPYTVDSIDGVPTNVAPPEPPKIIPSRDKVQILLNAPPNDQARLAGLFDKKYGAGSAAAVLNSRKIAPAKGTVTMSEDGSESWTPE